MARYKIEPYDGKLSRTVLRRESGRKPRDLSGPRKTVSYVEDKQGLIKNDR